MTDDDVRRVQAVLETATNELKRHFDVVAEGIGAQVKQVAEGVVLANQRLDGLGQRLDRLERGVISEVGEVKAAVKFSFAEIDRRVTALETLVSSLVDRVERLESR